jgi:hypothetical protein
MTRAAAAALVILDTSRFEGRNFQPAFSQIRFSFDERGEHELKGVPGMWR